MAHLGPYVRTFKNSLRCIKISFSKTSPVWLEYAKVLEGKWCAHKPTTHYFATHVLNEANPLDKVSKSLVQPRTNKLSNNHIDQSKHELNTIEVDQGELGKTRAEQSDQQQRKP